MCQQELFNSSMSRYRFYWCRSAEKKHAYKDVSKEQSNTKMQLNLCEIFGKVKDAILIKKLIDQLPQQRPLKAWAPTQL